MTVEARVLNIDEKKTVFGILDQNGSCGSGSCEGCSCSKKIKTISLPTSENNGLTVGTDVLIQQDSKQILHFFLILVLPILVLLGIQFLPRLLPWSPDKTILNILSMAGGLSAFTLTAILIRHKRKETTLQITKK